MKTTLSARRMMMAKSIFTRLLVLSLLGVELGLGAWLASGVGRTASRQSEVTRASISDLMIAAR